MAPRTTIELVRHAQALRRDQWQGGIDRERPLDRTGLDQARGIVRQLGGTPVDALYSSPYVRCRQTLEPLGAFLGLAVTDDECLGEAPSIPVVDGGDAWVTAAWLGGRAVGFLDRVVRAHVGKRLVACSHGDVIPAVVALLAGRDQLSLHDVRLEKAGRYTLEFNGARCVRATAHRPPGSEGR